MRKMFFVAAVWMLSLCAEAQTALWWSNADDNAGWYAFGTEVLETYSAAVFVPAGLVEASNVKVRGVSVNMGTPNFSDLKVWVATKLPALGEEADVETVPVAKGDIAVDEYSDVLFSQEYDLASGGLYVGYTFKVTSLADYGGSPLSFSDVVEPREGAFFYCTESTDGWQSHDGKLMLKIGLEGVFEKYAVSAEDFDIQFALKGSNVEVPVKLRNEGTTHVTSVGYTVEKDGVVSEEKTLSLRLNKLLDAGSFLFPVDADDVAGKCQRTLTITKVNGHPNGSPNGVAKGDVITMSAKPISVPVVEEFTGTWCGYCPYGIVGMKAASERFGDRVVLLAIHASDVMETADYAPIRDYVSSVPTSLLNRQWVVYPSQEDLLPALESALERVVPGSVEASARWTDAERTQIRVDTKSVFYCNDTDTKFGIAFVVVADGLSGSTGDWYQRNFLSGGSGLSNYAEWYAAPAWVTEMTFDHVPVAAWGILGGVEGSVNSPVADGEEQQFDYLLNVSGNDLIQDKSKLSVVALLMNRSTGRIVNAAQTTIGEPDPDVVRGLESRVCGDPDVSYNLQGLRVGADYHGIVVRNGKKVKK